MCLLWAKHLSFRCTVSLLRTVIVDFIISPRTHPPSQKFISFDGFLIQTLFSRSCLSISTAYYVPTLYQLIVAAQCQTICHCCNSSVNWIITIVSAQWPAACRQSLHTTWPPDLYSPRPDPTGHDPRIGSSTVHLCSLSLFLYVRHWCEASRKPKLFIDVRICILIVHHLSQ